MVSVRLLFYYAIASNRLVRCGILAANRLATPWSLAWYSAYDAAKHDRAKDLSQANLENLLGDWDNHRDVDTQFTSQLEYAQALLHTGGPSRT